MTPLELIRRAKFSDLYIDERGCIRPVKQLKACKKRPWAKKSLAVREALEGMVR